jgi:hypothetical protein
MLPYVNNGRLNNNSCMLRQRSSVQGANILTHKHKNVRRTQDDGGAAQSEAIYDGARHLEGGKSMFRYKHTQLTQDGGGAAQIEAVDDGARHPEGSEVGGGQRLVA